MHETKAIFIFAFPITWPKFQFSTKGITSNWSAGLLLRWKNTLKSANGCECPEDLVCRTVGLNVYSFQLIYSISVYVILFSSNKN